MIARYSVRSAAVLGLASFLVVGTGCATKKHVRQVVAPVEARVGANEKKTSDHASAIGELENNVSRVDEKALEADRKAAAAGEAALQAGQAAQQAGMRADTAHQLAESTRSRLGTLVENLDNYQMIGTEAILFNVNKANLTKQAKAQLDEAVTKIQGSKNYVLEIQGFTDKTGGAEHNLALSQKRADAVVRYLTVQHNLPLRKINVLGVGEDDPNADNKTREGRKQARRVEIKVFALSLDNQGQTNAAANSATTPSTTGTSTPTTTAPAQIR